MQILILQNKIDDATKINDAVLKAAPADIDAQVLRGQILNRQAKFQDAVNLLASVAKDAPDSAMAHYQLGIAYAGLSNLGQAETEWRTAARLQPDKIEPQRALAVLAEQNKNTSLLTDASQALIRTNPTPPRDTSSTPAPCSPRETLRAPKPKFEKPSPSPPAIPPAISCWPICA